MSDVDHLGTHVTHCCLRHGCKYGDDDCPVTNDTHMQRYMCEDCSTATDAKAAVNHAVDEYTWSMKIEHHSAKMDQKEALEKEQNEKASD